MATPDHFLPSERRAVYLLIAVLFCGALLVHFGIDPGRLAERLTAGEEGVSSSEEPAAPVVGSINVIVTGAVARQGGQRLESAPRIADALFAAGGLLPTADPSDLEMDRFLAEGELIHIPPQPEGFVPTSENRFRLDYYGAERMNRLAEQGESPYLRINVNTADVAELDKLPGVGPVTAARIVEARSTRGPFLSVGDLSSVQGIGAVTLERIRPFVIVEEAP